MANVKISQLPASGPLVGTDAFALVQGGATRKASIAGLDARNDGRYYMKGAADTPGAELAYSQITSTVTVNATSNTSPTMVAPGIPVTCDGSLILVFFTAFTCQAPNVASGQIILTLWDGSTDLGWLGTVAGQGVAAPVSLVRRLGPTAGSHTYSVRAWCPTGTGGSVSAGAGGGPNTLPPAMLRITKV